MVVGCRIRRRRPGIREQSRSGRTETRIRRGDGQQAEPLGFRRGVWHGSFGNSAFDIYKELQTGGCVYLDQVHTANCRRYGEPGSRYAGRKSRTLRHRLHRHLLDTQPCRRGEMDTLSYPVGKKRQGKTDWCLQSQPRANQACGGDSLERRGTYLCRAEPLQPAVSFFGESRYSGLLQGERYRLLGLHGIGARSVERKIRYRASAARR